VEPERAGDFVWQAAIFGVLLGGRLGYCLLYDPALLWSFRAGAPWWEALAIHEGGMSAHGGVAGVALFSLAWARRRGRSWLAVGDDVVCAAPAGLFFGRVANFINGELIGRAWSGPWAVRFPSALRQDAPPGALIDGVPIAELPREGHALAQWARETPERWAALEGALEPRHPSQLYEAALEGAGLLAALLALRLALGRRMSRGVAVATFFIGYAAARFFVEFFRAPDWGVAQFGPLTRGQGYSLLMAAGGAAFFAAALLRGRRDAGRRGPKCDQAAAE